MSDTARWPACNRLSLAVRNKYRSLAVRNKYRGFIEKMWSKREEIFKMRGQPAWCGEEKITPCCLCIAHRLKRVEQQTADWNAKGRGEEMRRQEEKTQCRYKENTGRREPEPLALATGCEVAGGKLKLYVSSLMKMIKLSIVMWWIIPIIIKHILFVFTCRKQKNTFRFYMIN